MSETITVQCSTCSKPVVKLKKEYNRRLRLGKDKFYCNNSCATHGKSALVANFGKVEKILGRVRQPDELSPFRYIFNQVKNKSKARKIQFELTVEDLLEQWKKQNGICPYTKYQMIFPSDSTAYKKREANPYFASLDRIDSNKGYEVGNIEFVCVAVNYAKNGFSRDIMLKFFRA